MANRNEQLVIDWVEQIWNQQNLDRLGEFHPPTFQNEGGDSTLADTHEWHNRISAVYPDLSYTIEQIFESDGQIAFRWTATGTHKGALWGFIQPTGKTISWNGLHMVKVEDGKIVDVRAVSNTLAQLQQMGVQLQPATAAE